MPKMIKDGQVYDIDDNRVAKLLNRGFKLVDDKPVQEEVIEEVHEDESLTDEEHE